MENIKLKPDHIIRCPYCDTEYFPSEIFIPKNFLGTAHHSSREICLGMDMDLSESYTCDSCNNIFVVEAQVSFICTKAKINTFEEDF